MKVTPAGLALLQAFEACRLAAYRDSGGVWTIGWGTTRYPNGRPVLPGDTCSQAQADQWFAFDLGRVEVGVDALTRDDVTPAQFDALVSFAYNCGEAAYRASTLRRKVNADPADPTIRAEFMKWHYDNGTPVPGLRRRRQLEADHYFGVTTPVTPFPQGGHP